MSKDKNVASPDILANYEKIWGVEIIEEILSKEYREKYDNIKKFPDHAYTYCIAYEMLVRTKEYKKFKKMKRYKEDGTISSSWIEEMELLGLDLSHIDFDTRMILQRSQKKEEDPVIRMDSHFRTINDINDGLRKLITFYLKKKKIRQLKQECENSINAISFYEESTKFKLADVLADLKRFHIPYNSKTYFRFGSDLELDENIPLYCLEEKFLRTLSLDDFKEKYIQVEPNFPRPILNFKESRIINLPINLNLNKKELTAYISKIKDEYDSNFTKVQAPIDLIDKVLECVLPLSVKKMYFSPKRRKKTIADAFYIYDTFQKLKQEAEKKKNEIRITLETQKQSNDFETENKNTISDYQVGQIYDLIEYVRSVPKSVIPSMYKFMKEYIDDLKYKDLITSSQPYK